MILTDALNLIVQTCTGLVAGLVVAVAVRVWVARYQETKR